MTGPTILVADDEDTVRLVVGRMLRASGFALLEARDGREAPQVVQQREHPPDLILTDVVMPLLNGGELASRVRASRARPADPAHVCLRSGGFAAARFVP